jgi:hypothetical protein
MTGAYLQHAHVLGYLCMYSMLMCLGICVCTQVSAELLPGGKDVAVTANNIVQYKALISDYWLTRRIADQVHTHAHALLCLCLC